MSQPDLRSRCVCFLYSNKLTYVSLYPLLMQVKLLIFKVTKSQASPEFIF